jgi:hypothetical protein
MTAITWVTVPREFRPDFLRRAGSFQGKPTGYYWIETLRTSEDIKVGAGGRISLSTWAAEAGGRRYLIDVLDGRLAVEGNCDIY